MTSWFGKLVRLVLDFRPGRLGMKRYFPPGLYNHLKVCKYYLWLAQYQSERARNGGLLARIRAAGHALNRRAPRVLFYPDVPFETAAVYEYCLMRGLHISNDPRQPCDLAIKWRDATYYQPDSTLLALAQRCRVINARCNDISKRRLAEAHQAAFGYCAGLDPRTHAGPMVQKSNTNALHDGKIVSGPLVEPDPRAIYQILIDNTAGPGQVLDIRVAVFNSRIPLVRLCYKDAAHRFQEEILRLDLCRSEEAFTPGELRAMEALCRELGLEYGELDVLRDFDSGRIYVVDANNTPDGWLILDAQDQAEYERAADTFMALMFDPPAAPASPLETASL
jgi:hypothetical protein